jgi:hypothetical protein
MINAPSRSHPSMLMTATRSWCASTSKMTTKGTHAREAALHGVGGLDVTVRQLDA